ncbi:MAG TPA: SdrD B-like domain-containing protein [Candidatus Dojkabacteria bacterium]|nr:SdrD B-like domain-containing protein [Candidatus Dojkabacteria bacterium]HRP51234.1 SdrD B-like domain-containing protein [Candidatus Dojkabacteria bacterium]
MSNTKAKRYLLLYTFIVASIMFVLQITLVSSPFKTAEAAIDDQSSGWDECNGWTEPSYRTNTTIKVVDGKTIGGMLLCRDRALKRAENGEFYYPDMIPGLSTPPSGSRTATTPGTDSQWYKWGKTETKEHFLSEGTACGLGPRVCLPTPTPTKTPSPTPTIKPSATPTIKPSATPTTKPSATPTTKPSATPTTKPSATPTTKPSATPTPVIVLCKLGDRVVYDQNKNGIQEIYELGVRNIKVELYSEGMNLLGTEVTNTNGFYGFDELDCDTNYYVKFYKPADYIFSEPFVGNNRELDSNANVSTGLSDMIYLTGTDLSIDALIYKKEVVNTPTPSITPTTKPSTTPTTKPSATPTTKPSATPTTKPSATPTTKPSATPTVVPSPTPTIIPSPTPTTVPSATPTTKPSATPTTEPSPTPVVILCKIGDRVVYDQNKNGIQDIYELGVKNIKVELYDEQMNVLATQVTNDYGFYIFDELVCNTNYYIKFFKPADYKYSEAYVGNNTELDSNANVETGLSEKIMLIGTDLSIDALIYKEQIIVTPTPSTVPEVTPTPGVKGEDTIFGFSVDKTIVGDYKYNVGELVTYRVTLENSGTDIINKITMRDVYTTNMRVEAIYLVQNGTRRNVTNQFFANDSEMESGNILPRDSQDRTKTLDITEITGDMNPGESATFEFIFKAHSKNSQVCNQAFASANNRSEIPSQKVCVSVDAVVPVTD